MSQSRHLSLQFGGVRLTAVAQQNGVGICSNPSTPGNA